MAMGDEAKISAIRQAARRLGFESPSRGAVVLQRLGYALPPSESLAELTEAQRAFGIMHRTILHSHSAHLGLDQYGNGYWVMFRRQFTEGAERWELEVDVTVDQQDRAVISDVRIKRPGDRDDDDDEETEREEPPLTKAELPFGMLACPCCGHATLSERGRYEICPVCFWEDDGQDNADAAVERGGPNQVSLVQGRVSFLRIGASVEADRTKVRGPTGEELRLRHFAEDGREIEG